jgi:enoyl-CoA hydratase/carnithine racemase
MIYTSRLLEADEALQIGLVSELCDDHAALMQRTHALAAQIAGYAPLTLRATKEILRRLRQVQPRIDDDDIVGKVYTSADFREGLDAFLTKRKPNWTGR